MFSILLHGTVHSVGWSVGADCRSGVLEWNGFRFWSGKCWAVLLPGISEHNRIGTIDCSLNLGHLTRHNLFSCIAMDFQFTTIRSETKIWFVSRHASFIRPVLLHRLHTALQTRIELLSTFASNSYARLYMCQNIEINWLVIDQTG